MFGLERLSASLKFRKAGGFSPPACLIWTMRASTPSSSDARRPSSSLWQAPDGSALSTRWIAEQRAFQTSGRELFLGDPIRRRRLGQIFEQAFQVLRGQRLKTDRHNREGRCPHAGDVLPLNDMILTRQIQNLNRRLCFGLQTPREGPAVFGGHIPQAVIG